MLLGITKDKEKPMNYCDYCEEPETESDPLLEEIDLYVREMTGDTEYILIHEGCLENLIGDI